MGYFELFLLLPPLADDLLPPGFLVEGLPEVDLLLAEAFLVEDWLVDFFLAAVLFLAVELFPAAVLFFVDPVFFPLVAFFPVPFF